MSAKWDYAEVGSGKMSLSLSFTRCLKNLPVDLTEFVRLSKTNPDVLFTEQTLDRIVQIVLVEQDTRISNKATKLQAIEILRNIANIDRTHKYLLRPVLQDCKKWFDDDVDPDVRERTLQDGHGELLPEKDKELVMKVKLLFGMCWRTPPLLLKGLVQDETITIEQSKNEILRHYAATAMQATLRSKAARLTLQRSLSVQAAEQEEEVRQWSVLVIQKVARGYIARKTVLKSMQIRKTLNKEVLRIAERYLQHGDLWGFLKEINSELNRSYVEIKENQAREDNWAENFVEKVIQKRQTEFNTAWEEFPRALHNFSGKDDATGALLTKSGIVRSKKSISPIKQHSPNKTVLKTQLLSNGANNVSSMSNMSGLNTTVSTVLPTRDSSSSVNTVGTIKSKKYKISAMGSSRTDITAMDVGQAMQYDAVQELKESGGEGSHLSVPGVLMRKALGTTVQAEVAEQLNKLINGQFRSRQLVKSIKDVYGPLSDPINRTGQNTNKSQLTPLDKTNKPVNRRKKKKKKVGLKGEIIEDVGRIDAAHSDWVTAAVQNNNSSQHQHPQNIGPGSSLLIDIPQGINDTIERLMHAAALRCYVPDFFQGVSELSNNPDLTDSLLDQIGDTEMDEARVEQLLLQRKQHQDNNPNNNAAYAYSMYLKMPFGLAKMRYEVQCKKYAQGPINRLRLKGLSFLSDVHPVSKFVMCMKSVDTPRILLNKCVDIYLELKAIGPIAPLGQIDRSTVEKFHRSVHTSQGSLPALSAQSESQSCKGDEVGFDSEVAKGNTVGTFSSKFGDGRQRSRSVQFVSNPAEHGLDASESMNSPPPKKGEIGFESVAEGDTLNMQSTTIGETNAGASISAYLLGSEFPDTVEGRAAQRRAEKRQSELPGKMLLSMVENKDQMRWCDLRAPVEDIFLHAAFLVVPHVSFVPDLSGVRMGSSASGKGWMEQRSFRAGGSAKMKRVESEMGNIAFKQHTAEVLKMTDENQKREAVKDRFRAAFILTTPFTLYLKSKRVYTVDDLLRVNLHDLGMPPALETQLEVLLTAVVSKCVDAKIVPVPRDHLSTAAELFTVPMFYDPKFQRSPFDPFGRPPRLQQKGSHKLVQQKLKATERKQIISNKAHNNLNKVASVESIQEDLNQPVTLWTTSAGARTEGTEHMRATRQMLKAENQDGNDSDSGEDRNGSSYPELSQPTGSKLSLGASLLDDSEFDQKWTFQVEDGGEGDIKSQLRPGTKGTSRPSTTETGYGTDRKSEGENVAVRLTAVERVREMMERSEIHQPVDNNTWKKSLRSHDSSMLKSPNTTKPRKDTKQFSQDADLMTRNIEDKVFKYSFVCTHPHCGQVFARQYTYNIHLKSHALFGQYHDYKRQPQLFLDKDKSQIEATKQKQFEERISLPPLIQAELR